MSGTSSANLPPGIRSGLTFPPPREMVSSSLLSGLVVSVPLTESGSWWVEAGEVMGVRGCASWCRCKKLRTSSRVGFSGSWVGTDCSVRAGVAIGRSESSTSTTSGWDLTHSSKSLVISKIHGNQIRHQEFNNETYNVNHITMVDGQILQYQKTSNMPNHPLRVPEMLFWQLRTFRDFSINGLSTK